MAVIAMVLPTINGRQDVYEFVRGRYEKMDYEGHTLEIHMRYGQPTVGCAWQMGMREALKRADYILLGNDDCEPHAGWWRPAIEAVDAGYLPSPQVYDTGGYPQGLPEWGKIAPDWTPVGCALIPFFSKAMWEQIGPLFTGHYYTDNFITERAKAAGWPCVLRTGFAFTHYWSMEGRGAGLGTEPARMAYDRELYARALHMWQAGEWTAPWPPLGRAPEDTSF